MLIGIAYVIVEVINGKEYAVTELAEMGIEPKKYVSREKSWNKDHLNDPYPQKRIVNYNGVDYTLKELSEVIGISFNTLNTRYSKGFSDKDIIKEVNRLHKYCPVIQKDDHCNIICRFGSIKEASEKTGIRKSGINMCCNGQRKHCGGYVWEKDLESQKCEKRMRILKRHKEGGWIDNRGKLIDEID